MRTCHLFAGAGGGMLADLLLGHRPTVAVEIDKNARAILEARRADGWFPDLQLIHDDIRTFDARPWQGRIDLVAGGFPCQDISVAGKGGGLAGERSGLFYDLMRVVREVRPRFVFLENSPAITLRGLDRVLAELAEAGCDAEWLCLPASRVGAPHRRDRWWLLARMADADARLGDEPDEPLRAGRPAAHVGGAPVADAHGFGRSEGRPEPEGRQGRLAPDVGGAPVADANGGRCEQRQPSVGHVSVADACGADLPDAAGDGRQQRRDGAVAFACSTGLAIGQGPQAERPHAATAGSGGAYGSPEAVAQPRLGGDPDGLADWLDESRRGFWQGNWERGIPRVAERARGRVARLHAIGNGQVPQCAALAFLTLMERFER